MLAHAKVIYYNIAHCFLECEGHSGKHKEVAIVVCDSYLSIAVHYFLST